MYCMVHAIWRRRRRKSRLLPLKLQSDVGYLTGDIFPLSAMSSISDAIAKNMGAVDELLWTTEEWQKQLHAAKYPTGSKDIREAEKRAEEETLC